MISSQQVDVVVLSFTINEPKQKEKSQGNFLHKYGDGDQRFPGGRKIFCCFLSPWPVVSTPGWRVRKLFISYSCIVVAKDQNLPVRRSTCSKLSLFPVFDQYYL